MYDEYLPVIITALVMLVLACWNPKVLQEQKQGQPQGRPSYVTLSLLSLLAGIFSVFLMRQ